jgi:glycosyltransferase involved in cell wall biosynthesis
LGVAADVIFTGAIPHHDACTYLAGADVAVVPSVAESFSRVVIEACAVGTPPVVTRTTGASAYVAAAQAGIVVEPRSGPAIGEAIVTLLRDRAVWQAYSARAAALAPQFSSQRIATELSDLYRNALLRKAFPETVATGR